MSDKKRKQKNKQPPVIRKKSANGGGLPHPKVPDASAPGAREENGSAPPRVNLKKKEVSAPSAAEETARILVPGVTDPDITERIDVTPTTKEGETERISVPSNQAEGAAPDSKAEHAARMSQTDRIDLSAAKKPGETGRIDIGGAAPPAETDRIDLASAKPKSDTSRIDPPEPPQPATEDDEEEFTAVTLDPEMLKKQQDAKAPRPSTDRIDLAETIPMEPLAEEKAEAEAEASPEQAPAEAAAKQSQEDLLAATTVPIESMDAKELMSAETLPIESILGEDASEEARAQGAAFMNQTMRVELDPDEAAKGETARINKPEPPASTAPGAPGTARVDLPKGATNGEDVLRRAAKGVAGVGAAGAAASRSRPPAPEPKPSEEDPVGIIAPQKQSKPGTARIEVEPPTKSATARIEVDDSEIPHAPPRPKSIKLKRAGAEGAAKKPEQPADAVKPAPGLRKVPGEDSFGPLVGGAALATVLIMAVLIYVLAAQTIATNLPFPGRM